MTSRPDSLRELEREVSVLVRRIRKVIGERAHATHEDLQPAGYLMLAWLADEGPVRASSMVENFNVDKGAVSRQVQHLVELGLVVRTPDPKDGRASLIAASDDAKRRLSAMTEQRRKMLDEQLAGWSAEELTSFVAALGRYNEALNASTP